MVSALPTVLPSRLVCLPPLCLPPASWLQPGDLCPLVATSSDYSCGLVLSHCTSLPASASRLRSHAGRAPWPSVWASLFLSRPLPSAEAVLSCRSWALQPPRALPRQQPHNQQAVASLGPSGISASEYPFWLCASPRARPVPFVLHVRQLAPPLPPGLPPALHCPISMTGPDGFSPQVLVQFLAGHRL